ncbi:MAG: tRNA (adenosine(37)-N6)-dimethylallyltransferase MiaA [Deltaproteobacteria bacterium]|nr:tRNA (adenosine(37)-N6)-dimethylallyltransferase MiaA [Deltaproteobacteria bacterium]
MSSPLPVLLLAGPTAAGKTAAALHVAHGWGARIVSADAMQVYRGMDVGTGKAPPAVLRRFPHACVDVRDPDEPWCAADFAREADAAVAGCGPVVVVGGTVFYLRTFLFGLAPTPGSDPELRAALEAEPDPHAILAATDPVLAARLHPHDRVRVVRALEVHRLTGRPLSAWHADDRREVRHPHRVLWLDRLDLYARIDARVERMMERGYLAEVHRLLESGVAPDLKPMRSLGYRHLADHVVHGLALGEAVRRTKRDTRHFARKQRAWSRQHADWIRVDAQDRGAVLAQAEALWGPPVRRVHPL